MGQRELPEYNFGILINSRKEAETVGEIARKHYPDYKKVASFNGDNNHLYYVIKTTRGELMWTHCSGTSPPVELSEILTLDEFTKKYLEVKVPEVINNYQIY